MESNLNVPPLGNEENADQAIKIPGADTRIEDNGYPLRNQAKSEAWAVNSNDNGTGTVEFGNNPGVEATATLVEPEADSNIYTEEHPSSPGEILSPHYQNDRKTRKGPLAAIAVGTAGAALAGAVGLGWFLGKSNDSDKSAVNSKDKAVERTIDDPNNLLSQEEEEQILDALEGSQQTPQIDQQTASGNPVRETSETELTPYWDKKQNIITDGDLVTPEKVSTAQELVGAVESNLVFGINYYSRPHIDLAFVNPENFPDAYALMKEVKSFKDTTNPRYETSYSNVVIEIVDGSLEEGDIVIKTHHQFNTGKVTNDSIEEEHYVLVNYIKPDGAIVKIWKLLANKELNRTYLPGPYAN